MPDARAHIDAIGRFAAVIAIRRRHHAVAPLSVLDIGGGFPVSYDGSVDDIEGFCAPIRTALAALPRSVRVLAEPGRYIAAPSMTCITSVVGRARRGARMWYYLDDGVYNSFSGQIFDHTHYPLIAPTPGARPNRAYSLVPPATVSTSLPRTSTSVRCRSVTSSSPP